MGIGLRDLIALEFFAREGDWQTQSYANQVKELHAWEIDPFFKPKLEKNLPNAQIRIGDSFLIAQEEIYKEKFDFIVFDNPQNIYGRYCEHFEALSLIAGLLRSQGVVIFNVNLAPFDYDKFPLWKKRRSDFYLSDVSAVNPQFFFDFYDKFFSLHGFDVKFKFEEKRNDEYLSYLVYSLSRVV
jgi:hypothetical protein